jgi:hypothetical protein
VPKLCPHYAFVALFALLRLAMPIRGACEKSIHTSTKSYASEFFGSPCGITPSGRKLVKRGSGGREKRGGDRVVIPGNSTTPPRRRHVQVTRLHGSDGRTTLRKLTILRVAD